MIRAFYGFAPLPHFAELREPLLTLCREAGLRGTILLADEGINGTMAGQPDGLDRLLARLRAEPGFADLTYKESFAPTSPFHRLKVRLKTEIVGMGDAEIDPTAVVGKYVEPKDWNALIEDPEVLVIDTRNDYEVRIGTFAGAVDPKITSFREFPQWVKEHLDPAKHRRVAMFCTGGIRCEKATSLLLREGFDDVFHLKGGVLEYLQQVDASDSAWRGECFVFDDRVALDHALAPGSHALCFGCKEPVSPQDRAEPQYEYGVCCARCHHLLDDETAARRRERNRQVELAEQRGEAHIGALDSTGANDPGES